MSLKPLIHGQINLIKLMTHFLNQTLWHQIRYLMTHFLNQTLWHQIRYLHDHSSLSQISFKEMDPFQLSLSSNVAPLFAL